MKIDWLIVWLVSCAVVWLAAFFAAGQATTAFGLCHGQPAPTLPELIGDPCRVHALARCREKLK